jgi:hypothetical protein
MTRLKTWILLANFHLDIQANSYTTVLDWVASPRGKGEGEGYDLLRQMTSVSLTSRFRSATARQAVLSAFRRAAARESAT